MELNQSIDLLVQSNKLYTQYWKENALFTPQWWFLLVLMILPWYIWWKAVDKRRVLKILAFGFLITVIVSIFDKLGSVLGLWAYPYNLFPVGLRLYPMDLSVLPVTYMLLYQYAPKWKKYIIITTIFGLSGIVVEYLFIWMGIYRVIHWHPLISVPIYIAIAILCKWLVDSFANKLPQQTLE